MSNSTVLVSNFCFFFFFLDHLIHLWVMIMKGYALQYLFMSCICGNFVQRKGLASLSVFGSIIKSHFRLESICCQLTIVYQQHHQVSEMAQTKFVVQINVYINLPIKSQKPLRFARLLTSGLLYDQCSQPFCSSMTPHHTIQNRIKSLYFVNVRVDKQK